MRWAGKDEAKEYAETWADLLSQEFGDDLLESLELLAKRGIRLHGERHKRAHAVVQKALARAADIGFLHWELAFPSVWSGGDGGFDAVIGNPPWDRMKLQEVEWFAERRPEIAKAVRAADRKKLIDALKNADDPLWHEYLAASDMAEISSRVARTCGDYPLLSGGDVNLYSLFIERASALIHTRGLVALLTPSGIAADKGAAEFFGGIAGSGRLASLYDFENKKVFFPDIDSRFKFCALTFSGEDRTFEKTRCGFYLHAVDERNDPERALALTAADFIVVNPNTGGAPIFRTQRDADITTAIYRRQPVLVDRRAETKETSPRKVWPVRYMTMFHMTNDSGLFKRRDELDRDGWYPVSDNHYKKHDAELAPLYEGKMVQMYDHRAANVVVHSDNLHRAAQQEAVDLAHHQDPKFSPTPQFWVTVDDVSKNFDGAWSLSYKAITAPTNMRTMISAILPQCGVGNSMSMLVPDDDENYSDWGPLLQANLASFAFDFVLRQKVQGQNLNLFVLEQCPVIRNTQFEAKIGKHKIADFVRGEVLRLSYTAHDLEPFARDLGHKGPPFKWDDEDRRHRMARLDALFFHLYGLSRDDAAYILDTFPIVREQDEKAFGRYLTKDLVLAYMNAVAAGDLASVVKIR